MALELYIPPCVNNPPHSLHPPPPDKSLRIRIQGPLETIQKLLPKVSLVSDWAFPQLGGLKLASLTYQKLYGGKGDEAVPVVRDMLKYWGDQFLIVLIIVSNYKREKPRLYRFSHSPRPAEVYVADTPTFSTG